ncbi:MAG: hypothetical protein H0U51_05530 [Propionibacteriales bacterium]|nr:hypothetical protein [Propionibacteriales bacterium]
MYERLATAIAAALHDIDAQGGIRPGVIDEAWADFPGQESAMLAWPDGSRVGIWVMKATPVAEQFAAVADQIQDAEVEALAAVSRSAVWPECPRHPNSHPLSAIVRDDVAVWACKVIDGVIAPIGALGISTD